MILATAFLVIYRLPGDPARMILGPRADAATVRQFRDMNGLNESVVIQFSRFLGRAVRFDFGESLSYRRPVMSLILERVRPTFRLVIYAMLVLIVLSLVLPICLRAMGLRSVDTALRSTLAILSAAPPYVLGLLAITTLAGALRVLPAIFDPDQLRCWLTAGLVLAAYPAALASRLLHDAIETAMTSDYATRARSQGFSEVAVLIRDVLLNALTAPISAIANGLAYFLTGTFFVEVAFGIGGLGSLTYEAIRNKDVPTLAGICVLFAVVISAISMGLDVVQRFLNPRSRRSYE